VFCLYMYICTPRFICQLAAIKDDLFVCWLSMTVTQGVQHTPGDPPVHCRPPGCLAVQVTYWLLMAKHSGLLLCPFKCVSEEAGRGVPRRGVKTAIKITFPVVLVVVVVGAGVGRKGTWLIYGSVACGGRCQYWDCSTSLQEMMYLYWHSPYWATCTL
jgi:hypothetical protein